LRESSHGYVCYIYARNGLITRWIRLYNHARMRASILGACAEMFNGKRMTSATKTRMAVQLRSALIAPALARPIVCYLESRQFQSSESYLGIREDATSRLSAPCSDSCRNYAPRKLRELWPWVFITDLMAPTRVPIAISWPRYWSPSWLGMNRMP
jgi:hypothetical protein